MKAIRSLIILLLLLLWPAGTASAGTLDIAGTVDGLDVRVSVAPAKASIGRPPAIVSVSTGSGSGTAVSANANRGPARVDAAVGCIDVRAASRLASANAGLCRENRDRGSLSADARRARSKLAAAIGCLRLAGASGHLRGNLLAGTCGATGGAADAHAGLRDTTLDGSVGCVVGNAAGDGSVIAAANVGVCQAKGTGPAPTPDDGPGGAGGDGDPDGVAGETTEGNSLGGVLGAAASGELPLTGLPLWAVVLTGLVLVGFGVLLRRRRPELPRPRPSF
jgi:hypothetical protein